MTAEGHVAACFLRVDVALDEPPSEEAYDALSERLQNLLQEAILGQADGGQEIDLRGMTCLVLGPVPRDETMEEVLDYPDNFVPIAHWLEDAEADEDGDVSEAR